MVFETINTVFHNINLISIPVIVPTYCVYFFFKSTNSVTVFKIFAIRNFV